MMRAFHDLRTGLVMVGRMNESDRLISQFISLLHTDEYFTIHIQLPMLALQIFTAAKNKNLM